MTELLGCPFCGARLRVRKHSAFHPENNCWLATAGQHAFAYELIEEEYAGWNTRTPSADPGYVMARDERQRTVAEWCAAAFGAGQASSIEQRGIRLLEEAIEAYQACGAAADMAHKMVDYIFARPAGTVEQELGGVGVTTLALANAAGLSADQCEAKEVVRVLAKPLSHFAARNQAKNDAGFHAAADTPQTGKAGEL